jgi:catechol 2,3-dioxygenase-like lactoylglutathione lyase family enzyme
MSADAVAPVPVSFAGVVLDSPRPRELADFYCRLLGWEIGTDEPDWVVAGPRSGNGTHLSFQREPEYEPPTWPSRRGTQQMMLHLDFGVPDLLRAHEHAVSVGATPTEWQPQEDVRVYTDPDGHVFCLFTEG